MGYVFFLHYCHVAMIKRRVQVSSQVRDETCMLSNIIREDSIHENISVQIMSVAGSSSVQNILKRILTTWTIIRGKRAPKSLKFNISHKLVS